MSRWQFILSSLRFHWRIHLAVALGVVAATAVLTGALLVGDSVRGSLRDLALERLGRIDEVLLTDHFFRIELASEVANGVSEDNSPVDIVPAILLRGTVESPGNQELPPAGNVTIIGTGPKFWTLESPGRDGALDNEKTAAAIDPLGVILNQPLADSLQVETGDDVLIRIGSVKQIPPDSPLGKKTETVQTVRLTVRQVIPTRGLGRFGLSPNQRLPKNAYLPLATLQRVLSQPGKANILFVADANPDAPLPEAVSKKLQENLHPQLQDYGLLLTKRPLGYYDLISDRMMIDPASEQIALKILDGFRVQPVLSYLANSITAGSRTIPYSTVAGIDLELSPPLGPFLDTAGNPIEAIADDEILLNAWAAEDLQVSPGDMVQLVYFSPESTHSVVEESEPVSFRLKGIVRMEGSAIDSYFVPELPGVTDQDSIDKWDPPFPFDANRVRDKDEEYWDEYRTTPKAFVSLAASRRMWKSRFGETTSLRIALEGNETEQTLRARLTLPPVPLGFSFQPIKEQSLQAASGTTPFNVLFLSFSFFVIAAALILVALLFRLGLEQRANEIGMLLAIGFPQRLVRQLQLKEALCVAALGGMLGLAAGIGYAWLMLAGLRTWWLGAVSTPFLELHMTPLSLLGGYVSGVLASLIAVFVTLRQMQRLPVRDLVAGRHTPVELISRQRKKWGQLAVWITLLLAGILAFAAMQLGGEAQAGAFFGSGSLVLGAGLGFVWLRLSPQQTNLHTSVSNLPLFRLALRSGSRNPGRSTLTIGLVAAVSFLIVAVSAFYLDPTLQGAGGFALVAESDQPLYDDLNSEEGRFDLGFDKQGEQLMARCEVVAFRVQAGDDASCLNLFQPKQPRILGVPPLLTTGDDPGSKEHEFLWGATSANSPSEEQNPWSLLLRDLGTDPDGVLRVPMILDANTALYSLHLGDMLGQVVGKTYDIEDSGGNPLRLQVVAVLKNSIFQGSLLLGEQALLRHFPSISGYSYFLIDTPPEQVLQIQRNLSTTLNDFGFLAEPSRNKLAEFMAVQNTYLQTFQSLGALGLLLGTFGLATVQLRSVLERRGELALMRAIGFRRRLLARMVMLENTLLLLSGLSIGILAALVAILPHLMAGGANLPWLSLIGTLGLVLTVGLAAGSIAVRATLKAPLLPALRGN